MLSYFYVGEAGASLLCSSSPYLVSLACIHVVSYFVFLLFSNVFFFAPFILLFCCHYFLFNPSLISLLLSQVSSKTTSLAHEGRCKVFVHPTLSRTHLWITLGVLLLLLCVCVFIYIYKIIHNLGLYIFDFWNLWSETYHYICVAIRIWNLLS